jgi:Na+(H+)/acetate symporter ActP
VVALTCIAIVAVASTVIGSFGVRFARNTSDFLVASRTVGATTNAGAISGEYLSAASFLGVAGLILKEGPDALWYPVGFTAGYLALLLFVSAPLRRSGAYTVPDFAEFRLRSPSVQRVCTIFVIIIGWMYLLPQLQGAGLTVATVVPNLPSWSGVVAAGVVVIATVVFGGMRSITFVQAFQYWLKLTALAVPVVALLVVVGPHHRPFNRPLPPQFPVVTPVAVKTDVLLRVTQPLTFSADGVLDGVATNGPVTWGPGVHKVLSGAQLTFPAHSSVPVPVGLPVRDSSWLTPLSGHDDRQYQLFGIYSLILATFLGTMGLPHVLVRFYTNPDGRATRRTTVVVLAMLGGFYLLPTLLGALSRLYVPQLLVIGNTDAAVLLLPNAALGGGVLATVLAGLVAAGAWAAFLSTSSGLVVGIAGVLSASPTVLKRTGVRDFRVAAVISGVLPLILALVSARQDFLVAVSLAFSVAASTFCPLLVLGIWWRGLTDRGALVGLLVGGASSTTAVTLSLFQVGDGGWLGVLLERPALVTVPCAFLTMALVSKMTSRRILPDVSRLLLRLHAPERLGLAQERKRGLDETSVGDPTSDGGSRARSE